MTESFQVQVALHYDRVSDFNVVQTTVKFIWTDLLNGTVLLYFHRLSNAFKQLKQVFQWGVSLDKFSAVLSTVQVAHFGKFF